jgi:hypothetical protein
MGFMEPRHPDTYNFPITASFMELNEYVFAPTVSLGTWVTPLVVIYTRPQDLHFRHQLITWELWAVPTPQSTNTSTREKPMTARFLSKTHLRHSRLRSVILETQGHLSHPSATKTSPQIMQFALENFRILIHNSFTPSRLRWQYPIPMQPTHFKMWVVLWNLRISFPPPSKFTLNSHLCQESN